MSQIFAEVVHEVQRVTEIAAEEASKVVHVSSELVSDFVSESNTTHTTNATNDTNARRLYGALVHNKGWFIPAMNSAVNTSLVRKPREKDAISWAPASLFLSFDAVQKMIHPLLPHFTVNDTQLNGTSWTPPWKWTPNSTHTPRLRCGHCNHSFANAPQHLQRARRRREPPLLLQRRLLSLDSYERLLATEMHGRARRSLQPNWTASAADIWSSPYFLNSPFQQSYNNTALTSLCGPGASTALGCTDTVALVLACLALLISVVTLACVWMLSRRLRQPEITPEKLEKERFLKLVPQPDKKFAGLP